MRLHLTCGVVNALQTFLKGLAAGMDIIADCHGLTKRALIDAGCPNTTAARLLTLADAYFGPTAFSLSLIHI